MPADDASSPSTPPRTHPKRNLPPALASPHTLGHISGLPRTAAAQRALERRAAVVLRAMDAAQIEAAYEAATARINAILDEDRRRNEELDREVGKRTAQRQLERKLWYRQKEVKAARKGEAAAGADVVKEEAAE